ncbi:MAG: hypothetical protein AMS24_01390 [Chlamydiae bacterium SM23_39]|nr:MAG: hypothetical protein AMS24_01390 [Chlamydiae bacterium SM23_39]
MKSLSDYTLNAIKIIFKAGDILKEGFYKHNIYFEKKGIHNLVTKYDTKSEEFIIKELKKKYPTHSFLSEEKGRIGKKEFEWIIDPLDGTVNFYHHIPFFSISIALKRKDEIILGIIFNPLNKELFIAEKGKGAYLNEKKIKVSKTKLIKNAILATGFPYILKQNPNRCINHFFDIAKLGLPIRKLGSAALNLAYVASGRFDVYWETNLAPWDYSAGKLIVEEAKGKISDWKGLPFKINKTNTILATNNKIHNEMVQILKK